MAQARESSLLFSLQSLLEVERERIDRDRAEQEQRLLEARRQRELGEQRAREAEQVRLQQERQREAERLLQAREEAARLEAIRLAEIERVRLDAAHRTELEFAARRHEHEQRLAALAQSSGRKRARIWLGLVAATGVTGAVAVAFYLQRSDAENRALIARYTALVDSKQEDLAKTSALLGETERRTAERTAELERQRQAFEQQLRDLQQKKATKTAPKSQPPKNSPPPPPRTNCDPNDPMCGELRR